MNANVIAIDGPAYVGKSVIAKALSEITGRAYINTGHMYRAVARVAMEREIAHTDARSLVAALQDLRIQFLPQKKEWRTVVDGQDWTDALDDPKVVLFSSKIAMIPQLREILTELQRGYAKERTVIMEGRDIGSVVFPDALWKFFITASLDVRARRMHKVLKEEEKRRHADFRALIPKVQEIDDADRSRKVSPLIEAPDAIVYDNSDSPSALQDALVLQYYVSHHQEIVQNGERLGAKIGKHS